MKKTLLNEVKQLQKIAGILKEYIESDPETITQAFQEAGIDLKKPVTYILDAGRGATDKPVKMLGSELLRKLEAMRAEGEANNPNYNEEEGVTYYFEPDGGEGPDFKLGVQFSDSLLYDIYQAKEMNELHPDDPAGSDVDDGPEEDPDDFDDISEGVDQKVLKAIEAYVDSKLGVVGSSEVVKKAINHIVAAYEKEKPTRELGAFIKNHFDDYAGRNIAYSELL
jgi:hypothetical protein